MTEKMTVPAFPKAMVRVVVWGGVYAPELRLAGDADAEAAAVADGFVAVPLPPWPLAEYPRWVYHADGRRLIIASAAARAALGAGWENIPVALPLPAPLPSVPPPSARPHA